MTSINSCPCGRKFDGTSVRFYSVCWYSAAGRIVYAICQHGVVVIDQRGSAPCPRELESTGVWPYVYERGETEGQGVAT